MSTKWTMVGFTDVDGTLIDSQILAITAATLPVMKLFQKEVLGLSVNDDSLFCWQTGRPVTNQQFLDSIGSRSMIDMLMHQNGLYDNRVPEDTLFQWDLKEAGAVIEAFSQPGALKRIPGARKLLSELQNSGVEMHAVSSSSVDRLCLSLRGVGLHHLIRGIYSAQGNNGYFTDDDEGLLARVHSVASPHHYKQPRPKPDPAVYHLACHLTGVYPENTFTVEDSVAGIESARAAGIGLILGLNNNGTKDDERKLRDAGATEVITKLLDGLPIIRERYKLPAYETVSA